MSTKPPPPCPPPRPDLESDRSAPVSKPSRSAPPPIPLRPDLGEGVDDNASSNVHIPKIPPPTAPKKSNTKRSQGRPEITIVSAQPMSSSGAFSPFVSADKPSPVPQAAAPPIASEPHPSSFEAVPLSKPTPVLIPGPPSTASKPSSFGTIPGPSVIPSSQTKTDHFPHSHASASPTTIAGLPATTVPAPLRPAPQISPPASNVATLQPSKPSPQIPAFNIAQSQQIRQAPQTPPTPTASSLQPLKPAPQVPTNMETSPLRVSPKTSRPREPPKRPTSKPVCEPSLANDPFQVGFQSNEVEKLAEPKAPKRKKNKTNKPPTQEPSGTQGFGINNSAFQELEANQIDDMFKMDEKVEMKKEEVIPSTSKKSKFPTVIRTKPNGKETPKSDSSAASLENVKELEFDSAKVKYTKPTVIKPQGKAKPPLPPSKKASQETTTGHQDQVASTPQPEPEPQQVKSKVKPTIIIPKVKKDESKKKEVVTSPTELSKTESETNNKSVEEKVSKPKKMPNIIRPNRTKKDKNAGASTPPNSRGIPEGQSQEGSQSQPKIVPARKAPPRPSPPKPGPPRPGPPKKSSSPQTRTQPLGTITTEVSHPELGHKGTAPLRPATIGKDKDIDKSVKNKHNNVKTTVVSSVVTTKIEPSCIALYDYDSGDSDDLSFKAGDEIFLIKRINPEWYIGRLDDCEGMIPLKFVEIIEDLPPEQENPQSKVSPKTSSLSTAVLYDFHGQSHDELSLYAGETVLLLEMINDEWLKGTCNGQSGIFPSNFVDLTPELKHKLSLQKQTGKSVTKQINQITDTNVTSGPRCKAVYDYHTDNEGDLKFNKDDIIKLTERINDEWLKGEVHGVVGMFPVAYVDTIEDLCSSPVSSSKSGSSSHLVAKALHDYISDADGDLSFKEGDIVTIVRKVNDEWLEGELNGHTGMFPSAFVENAGDSIPIESQEPHDHLLPKGKALYDFTGESDQELTFKTGDEIFLLQHINNEWMEGELNDQLGQFPIAFIEVLVPLP